MQIFHNVYHLNYRDTLYKAHRLKFDLFLNLKLNLIQKIILNNKNYLTYHRHLVMIYRDDYDGDDDYYGDDAHDEHYSN